MKYFLPSMAFALGVAAIPLTGVAFASPEADTRWPIYAMSANRPALLLELGRDPVSLKSNKDNSQVVVGEVSGHEGDADLQTDNDEIRSLHPGFGRWKLGFRFKLSKGVEGGSRVFWARWRQGGEPNVCEQTFEVWAGPDAGRLEKRGSWVMRPRGWDYAWVAAESPVMLKADDELIEIRNDGAGHDAKVFDAFLLAPPTAMLPVAATDDQPMALLELGTRPMFTAAEQSQSLRVYQGSLSSSESSDSVAAEKDEIQVLHSGFGQWGAGFRFELNPAVEPGQYRFFARYKSGGEVSQVEQRFAVKAGASREEMSPRGDFTMINDTPWEYQWLEAKDRVTVLPGDRWLDIVNSGKADGAKVFDAFLLKRESNAGAWMTAGQAVARNRFLAQTKPVAGAERTLYLLDGQGSHGESLLRGLASEAARPNYEKLSVVYLAGQDAETLASRLNIEALPAAVIGDDHHTLLGVMAKPESDQAVVDFLKAPDRQGTMPVLPQSKRDTPQPLKHGIPAAWLVGGLQDGQAGLSAFGLDSETVLRPNPDQPYLSLQMMGGEMRSWRREATHIDGSVSIEANTQHSYGWSRGAGYAQLYLRVDEVRDVLLHIKHSGTKSAGWLDGKPFGFNDDPKPPVEHSASQITRLKSLLQGLTTEGLVSKAWSENTQPPQVAALNLAPGWHSLLIKLTMQHEQGQRFYFGGVFTDAKGLPLENVAAQVSDPDADLARNNIAGKLRPLVFTDAPGNLPHPGDALKLRVDLRWHAVLEEGKLSAPLPRFPAKLRLRLVDYDGQAIATRETAGLFPGIAEVDFGNIPETGYYAVYPSLYTMDGRLIMHYPADGFSVVGGISAQRQRLDKKKLWNNDYYALADGDKSFGQKQGYFTWLERMGIFNSYGGYPGIDAQYRNAWEEVKRRGLSMFADSAGDSTWLNDNAEDGEKFIDALAPYTRFFKSSNEIDIRLEPEWQKLREPAHWVERAKREHQRAHQARNDAHYVGGSLVRPGEGDWFKQVLKLGLDGYQDAWDVHAYPQQSPRFGGPIGNGPNEDERGVLAAYASLGKTNRLPFWLGEVGAKAMHGPSGRRWQAEQAAKMIAWVNSRKDYLGLAFCISHEYDLAYGRIWDYSMGHKPGEAALYTAGALIDGLPYRSLDTGDGNIQAGYFGETLMIWRADDTQSAWPLRLDARKDWVYVDVVGRVHELPLDNTGKAEIAVSGSPVYVLPRAEYMRLIGL